MSVLVSIFLLLVLGFLLLIGYRVFIQKQQEVQALSLQVMTLQEQKNNLDINCRNLSEQFNNIRIDYVKALERNKYLGDIEDKYNKLLIDYNAKQIEVAELTNKLENEKKNIQEKMQLLETAEKTLADRFSALSAKALSNNNQSFLELAKASFENLKISAKNDMDNSQKVVADIIQPIRKTLDDVNTKLQGLEKDRISAYQAIHEQVKSLLSSQKELKEETTKLSSALKVPNVRGKWGEMQLRRVVEIAGMMKHCDFEEQVTVVNDRNDVLRPDMVIYLPGGKNIVVDAKTPLYAYSAALDAVSDEDKRRCLLEHAKHVRHHCNVLGSKKYLDQFDQTPDFVVMFLPGEIFFSAALEQDPSLIEFAMERKVVIATPTTLLALLHAVSMGWKNEMLSENAKSIIKLGKELYKRLADMSEHITKLGRNINASVEAYNSFSATLEKRVLVTVRKFNELESEKPLLELPEITNVTHKC